MKRIATLSVLLISIATSSVFAQTVPNAGFESWTSGGPFETPDMWTASPVVSKSTDFHSGSFAIQVKTDTFTNPMTSLLDTIPGMVNTGSRGFGPGAVNVRGYAFTSRPDSLVGWYKYAPVPGEMASFKVDLTKWNTTTLTNDVIGTAQFLAGGSPSYIRFSLPISYSSTTSPDSANIELSSGDPMLKVIGSVLLVDDLSFIYNTSGVADADASGDATLFYPNPATSQLSISNIHSDQVQLLNSFGQMVLNISTKNNAAIEISTAEYPSGMYWIKYGTDKFKKIEIQH